ncbi:Talin-1 [Podochytrium sp. JEL0797]|nr:Talin-1 [Podochytrium sp. JEL0797]
MSDSEPIDQSCVYALHTFVANVEGQVCVLKGDSLKLLDDSNYYWWLVKCVKTEEIGYIPAENIETPSERLARLNKFKNVQETLATPIDEAEPPAVADPTKPRLVFADSAIVFENYDDIDYDDDEEEGGVGGVGEGEEEGGVEEVRDQVVVEKKSVKPVGTAVSANQGGSVEAKDTIVALAPVSQNQQGKEDDPAKKRTPSLTIGTGFLKKLWKKDGTPASPVSPASPSQSPTTQAPAAPGPAKNEAPKKLINVLRIYTGNVDLKATYKAVALTPDMTTSQLLEVSLKRFRVQGGTSSDYFLSVLFMDSGEKPLDPAANVFNSLEALKNRSLPGVANFTKLESKSAMGGLLMNDDNIIKVIINKKLNLFEKDFHLVRVYQLDAEGEGRTYKTIGVNSEAGVESVTEIVKEKFKVELDFGKRYFLSTKIKGETKEIRRSPTEKIVDVLATKDGHPIDLEFILHHEPASPETIRKLTLAAKNTPSIATHPATGSNPEAGVLSFLDDGRADASGSEAGTPVVGRVMDSGDGESEDGRSVDGRSVVVEPSGSERGSIGEEAGRSRSVSNQSTGRGSVESSKEGKGKGVGVRPLPSNEMSNHHLHSLKIHCVDQGTTKTMQFSGATFIHDMLLEIRTKFSSDSNNGNSTPLGLDHGLFWPDTGKWLKPAKVLDYYDVKTGDLFEVKKKHAQLKVKTLDGSVKTVLVDESLEVAKLVGLVCERIGIHNPEEYSFAFDAVPANTLKHQSSQGSNSKISTSLGSLNSLLPGMSKEKKSSEGEESKWMNPELTLREQGVYESSAVILKKKFFYTDQNIDRDDPVQLNLLYNQAKEMILSGKHPCTLEEAAQFAAIQFQCQFGNHEADKHKASMIKLKEVAPVEYRSNRDLPKRIITEHAKLQGLSELNAKFRYVQLSRSLKTYGITFFLVKEKHTTKNKFVDVLLGVTKQSLVRLDAETKDVLKSWPLTQLRRWAAAVNSFTLDFGDYADAYYTVQTAEGDQISQLIAGYIDIILKKKKEADKVLHEEDEVLMTTEEYVKPVRAATAGILSTGQKQATETRVGTILSASNSRAFTKSTYGSSGLGYEHGFNPQTIGAHHSLIDTLTNGLAILMNAGRDVENEMQLPPLTDDPVSREWRQQTIESNVESVASQLASHLAYSGAIVNLLTSDFESMDFESIARSIKILTSNLTQMTNGVKLLSALAGNSEDKASFVQSSRAVYESAAQYVEGLQAFVSRGGSKETVYSSGQNVALTTTDLLTLIGRLEVSEDTQNELYELAKSISRAIAHLVQGARKVSETIADPDIQMLIATDAKLAADMATQLVACTSVVSPAVSSQICLDQLIEATVLVKGVAMKISDSSVVCKKPVLIESIHESVKRVEEAVNRLIERAKQSAAIYEVGPLDIEYDQVVLSIDGIMKHCSTAEEIISSAKDLTVGSTQYVNALKKVALEKESEDEREKMMLAARNLAELTTKMVTAAKEAARYPGDKDRVAILHDTVGYIHELVNDAAGQQLQKKTLQRLNKAVKDVIGSHNLLINAAQSSASSNRNQTSQLEFTQQVKHISEFSLVLASTVKAHSLDPENLMSQSNLLIEAQKIIPAMNSLIQAARGVCPTVGDISAQAHLSSLVNQTTADLAALEKAVSSAEDICSGLRLQSAIFSVGSIQSELNSTEEHHVALFSKSRLLSANELNNESIPLKLDKCVKDIQLSIETLTDAIATGDAKVIGQSASEAVFALQTINFTTSLMGTSLGSDLDFKLSIKNAASGVADTLAALISSAKSRTESAEEEFTDNSQELAAATKNALLEMEMCLPGKKELGTARKVVQGYSDTLKAQKFDFNKCPPETYASAQGKLQAVTGVLNTVANGLSAATRSSPAELQTAAIGFSAAFDNFISAACVFNHSCNNPLASTQLLEAVSSVCSMSDALLKSSTGVALDTGNASLRNELLANARNIGDALSSVVDLCSLPAPGHKDCGKSLQILMNSLNRLGQINDDLGSKDSYNESLFKITDTYKQITPHLSALSKYSTTSVIDPLKMAGEVVHIATLMNGMTELNARAAYLIGIADPTSTPATRPVIEQNGFTQAEYEIKEACRKLLDPNNKQEVVLELAGKVAKQTSGLCTLCKTVSSAESPVLQASKMKFVNAAKDVAGNTSSLVGSIKKLALQNDQQSRAGVKSASIPLIETVEKLVQYALSAEFSGTAAKISPQSAIAQKPLVDANRGVILASQEVVNTVKLLCSNPKDSLALNALTNDIRSLTDTIHRLIEIITINAPGQRECTEAVFKITENIGTLDAAIMDATVNNLEPVAGVNKDAFVETVRGLTSLIEVVARSALSDAGQLMNSVVELPNNFKKCITLAIGVASIAQETSTQIELLNQVKALSESIQSFMLTVKKQSGSCNTASNTPNSPESKLIESERAGIRTIVSKLIATVEGSQDKSGEYAKASETIEKIVSRLASGAGGNDALASAFSNKVSPSVTSFSYQQIVSELENAGKLMVEKVGDVLTKVKSADKFREYALKISEDYGILTALTMAGMAETNDVKVKEALLSESRQLGGVAIRLIETMNLASTKSAADHVSRLKLGQAGRDVSNNVSSLIAAAKEGTKALIVCEEGIISITDVIADLDSTLIFALAGNLDPTDSKDTFSKHKDGLLTAAKALTESVQSFAEAAHGSQEILISTVASTISSVRNLKQIAQEGAISISSGDKNMQQQLLLAAKTVSESLQKLVQTTNEAASKKHTPALNEQIDAAVRTTFVSISDLVRVTKLLGDESLRGERALVGAMADIDVALMDLESDTPAHGTALPDEVMQIAKLLVTTSAGLVSAGQQGKQDDLVAKAVSIRKEIEDLVRAGKAATDKAPTESKKPVVDAIKGSALAVKEILAAMKTNKTSSIQAATKSLAQSINVVISSAQLLIPTGYVDPNDPNVIAERELLSAAAAIEAASRKLAALKPQESHRDANHDLAFDEQILEAAKAIATATGALVRSATTAQREIVAAKAKSNAGKVGGATLTKAAYFSDGTWSDGLVSAAKQVAMATSDLCDSANQAMKGGTNNSHERVIASAKAVATTTAQLIAASSSSAGIDTKSQAQVRLRAAGKAVTHATDQLVKAAEDAGAFNFNEADVLSGANLKTLASSEASAKAMEMDAQVSILRMEKELEKARAKLAAVRKGKYDAKRQQTTSNIGK